jgi:YD repeat-containing protein
MPAGKTTAYTHDHMGRLIQKIKPDGVSLQYAYDELGRLKTLVSTDGSISYAYHYDLHNNPIEIQDLIHKTIQRCTYDELDRLIVEQISAGISLHYTYDALDRLIQFTLTDGSFILYTYDPFHLRHVQRFDAFGKLCYECDCLIYDQQGHVLQERSPAGMIDYTYDLLGRQIGIEAAHWKSQLEAFDPVGNLLARKQIDPSGEEKTVFCYDCFNHLTS